MKLVQEFFVKRNEAGNYIREKSKEQDLAFPKFNSDAEKFTRLKENPQINWFDEFSKLLSPLIDT